MALVAKVRQKIQHRWLARQTMDQLEQHLARRRGVLTLCYHALTQDLEGYPYRTTAAAFDAQLAFLRRVFDILPADTAIAALGSGGLAQRTRPIAVICFDDGYRCNWTQATPILERHEAPATLFAPRDLIRQPGQTYLSEAELIALAAHPLWDVGGHGVTHNVLPGFVPTDQAYEIDQSYHWLETLLGAAPKGFAYPQGQISPTVIAQTRARFAYAFSTDRRISSAYDAHQIRRFCPTDAHDDLHHFAQALVIAPMENGYS